MTFIFPYLGRKIPTDFHMFQRGTSTTNQSLQIIVVCQDIIISLERNSGNSKCARPVLGVEQRFVQKLHTKMQLPQSNRLVIQNGHDWSQGSGDILMFITPEPYQPDVPKRQFFLNTFLKTFLKMDWNLGPKNIRFPFEIYQRKQ